MTIPSSPQLKNLLIILCVTECALISVIVGTSSGASTTPSVLSVIPGSTTQVAAVERSSSGLAGWWKMDDASGTAVADSSGNADAGTLSGSPLPMWTAGK